MKKYSRWGAGCSFALLMLLIILVILAELAGPLLVHRDRLKSSEAIVILSGGGEERLAYGAELVNEGIARRIILTETDGRKLPDNQRTAIASLELLASKYGLDKNRIIITRDTSTSTYEEAQAVLETMLDRKWDGLVIVTDSFHSLRTSMIFRHIFRGSGIRVSVQPVDVSGYWYHPWYWWKDADSRQATILEYIKIIYFLAGRYE